MPRRKELHTIQRLAEHGADAASREVGSRLRALHAEEQRLRQVQGYLDHYDRLSLTGDGLTLAAVQSRRQFATRLREAVERQSRTVEQHRALYQRDVERWRDARARALSLQRYNERLRHEEQERRDRREQARLDEIARQRR